jgi:hypothetical protein
VTEKEKKVHRDAAGVVTGEAHEALRKQLEDVL